MLALLALSGCKKDAPEESTSGSTAPSAEQASGDLVSVAPDGTRFDPPVPASKIPDGAWMCDMNGEVHYASMAQGNGDCPVCGMHLVQKGQSPD